MDKRVLSPREAAAMLGVSTRTLQNYRDDGLIEYSQVGRKIFFSEKNLENFLKTFAKETFLTQKQQGKWKG